MTTCPLCHDTLDSKDLCSLGCFAPSEPDETTLQVTYRLADSDRHFYVVTVVHAGSVVKGRYESGCELEIQGDTILPAKLHAAVEAFLAEIL